MNQHYFPDDVYVALRDFQTIRHDKTNTHLAELERIAKEGDPSNPTQNADATRELVSRISQACIDVQGKIEELLRLDEVHCELLDLHDKRREELGTCTTYMEHITYEKDTKKVASREWLEDTWNTYGIELRLVPGQGTVHVRAGLYTGKQGSVSVDEFVKLITPGTIEAAKGGLGLKPMQVVNATKDLVFRATNVRKKRMNA